jgi:hypothetical protein
MNIDLDEPTRLHSWIFARFGQFLVGLVKGEVTRTQACDHFAQGLFRHE